MDSIIGLVLVLGAFAVIYIIANKLGVRENGSNNAASESDCEKNLNVNNFGKPLTSVAVVTCPLWLKFVGIIVVVVVIQDIFVAIDEINRGVFSWDKKSIRLIIILITAPLLFSALNTKFIFDNDGITVKAKYYFLFFTIHNESTFTPWDQINNVDYEYDIAYGEQFGFTTTNNFISILFRYRNYRKSLVFAVRKLPRDKFTIDAQEKLKKMGIWPDESNE